MKSASPTPPLAELITNIANEQVGLDGVTNKRREHPGRSKKHVSCVAYDGLIILICGMIFCNMVESRDNPQKRMKTVVQEKEGLFGIEADALESLNVDSFDTNVIMPALRDIKVKKGASSLASSWL